MSLKTGGSLNRDVQLGIIDAFSRDPLEGTEKIINDDMIYKAMVSAGVEPGLAEVIVQNLHTLPQESTTFPIDNRIDL